MCHKSILSTRCYHSTSDGLTAAHMAQGGAAPPLSESGRTLFVWLDVGQMVRTWNPGRCDCERRWYLLAVAGSRITSRHVLQLPPTVSLSVCHGHYSGMSVRVWRRPADLARNGGSCDGRSFQLPTSKTPPSLVNIGRHDATCLHTSTASNVYCCCSLLTFCCHTRTHERPTVCGQVTAPARAISLPHGPRRAKRLVCVYSPVSTAW